MVSDDPPGIVAWKTNERVKSHTRIYYFFISASSSVSTSLCQHISPSLSSSPLSHYPPVSIFSLPPSHSLYPPLHPPSLSIFLSLPPSSSLYPLSHYPPFLYAFILYTPLSIPLLPIPLLPIPLLPIPPLPIPPLPLPPLSLTPSLPCSISHSME